jgi:hypothetical protein
MNEQIRELAEQAGFLNKDEESIEYFAELIVRECAEHALTFNNNLQSLNDKEIRSHSSRVSDYIKDRMGFDDERSS